MPCHKSNIDYRTPYWNLQCVNLTRFLGPFKIWLNFFNVHVSYASLKEYCHKKCKCTVGISLANVELESADEHLLPD